jgi:glycosyltransferase involved in cell wall biosynthesis
MNICKVWDSEYPWDVRVEKVSRALTAHGHAVHLVARNRKNDPTQEERPEAAVHRLAWIPRVGKRMNAILMFPAFFNPRWWRLIDKTVTDTDADLLLCRDLPLAVTAIAVARWRGIPVVLDMAENYPAMIRDVWDSDRHRKFDWLVRNPWVVGEVERYVIHAVDHILVVVEESRTRLEALGVPRDRITIVSNTPPRERLSLARANQAELGVTGLVPHVVYLGNLEVPRGVGILLEAVAICHSEGLDLQLSIIGDGRDRREFEATAARLFGSASPVTFYGHMPSEEALAFLADAHIGVVPHFASESWNTTIPNKLFDYMACGLAVVTSDAGPAARVVRETGCGLVYRDRDAHALAGALHALADASKRRTYGAAGREAVGTQYNWHADSERLISAVRDVVHA